MEKKETGFIVIGMILCILIFSNALYSEQKELEQNNEFCRDKGYDNWYQDVPKTINDKTYIKCEYWETINSTNGGVEFVNKKSGWIEK